MTLGMILKGELASYLATRSVVAARRLIVGSYFYFNSGVLRSGLTRLMLYGGKYTELRNSVQRKLMAVSNNERSKVC